MLIVGGGAALTAITIYLAWIFVKSIRAAWLARRAERRKAGRDGVGDAARRHEAQELHHSH
jgi:hypothetical protein